MKKPIAIALVVLALGALIWLVVQQTGSTPVTNTVVANAPAVQNVSVAGINANAPDRIVRGPYPKDAEGCTIIDLRGKPPTEHDPAAKTYTWLIEHPESAPCVRQTPPTIAEEVKNTLSEKVRDTRNWKYSVYY